MVNNLEDRNIVAPKLSREISEETRDVSDWIRGEGKYAYLKERRKECEVNGHKEPVQLMRYPSPFFDDHPFRTVIPMYCKYCEIFYGREPTSEEIKMYHLREERFRELVRKPMTI